MSQAIVSIIFGFMWSVWINESRGSYESRGPYESGDPYDLYDED